MRRHLTANLLGIPFGLAGLAQCWFAAGVASVVPAWTARVCWVAVAVVYVVVATAYCWNVVVTGRARTELFDATFAPFLALLFVVPMMLGVAVAGSNRTLGTSVFSISMVATVLFGGWLSGQWIVAELRLEQWHPGYFLPTVGGGLIAAAGCAALGYDSWARVMFGYGAFCWLALGSILLARLFVAPALPPALLPTMAIEVAPAVVAGNAWLQINGDRRDTLVLLLSGYALLMVLVQVRLVPLYARLVFAPGWWAFAFSYAAAAAFAILWTRAMPPAQGRVLTIGLLALVTLGIGALAARTVLGLVRGTFLPPALTPTPSTGARPRTASLPAASAPGPHPGAG